MSLRLWPRRTAGGVAAGALTFAALGTGLAGAQVAESISVVPGSGPLGTEITVSGGGCIGLVNLVLLHGDDTVDLSEAVADLDGEWTGALTVDPGDESLAGETLDVTATCIGDGPEYSSGTFVVDAPDEPTTTTTTPTTTEPDGSGGGGQSPGTPSAPGDAPATDTRTSGGSISETVSVTLDPMPPATPVVAEPAQVG